MDNFNFKTVEKYTKRATTLPDNVLRVSNKSIALGRGLNSRFNSIQKEYGVVMPINIEYDEVNQAIRLSQGPLGDAWHFYQKTGEGSDGVARLNSTKLVARENIIVGDYVEQEQNIFVLAR